MKRYLKPIAAAVLHIILCLHAKAQISYTMSADTGQAYAEPSGLTYLNSDTAAYRFRYTIPIGFSYSFMGASFDSVHIETNGYLVFGDDNERAFMALNNFHCKRDTDNKYSSLSYNVSGAPGSRILRIQYKNLGQTDYPAELASYQVWLKEGGDIEFVMGPNTYERAPGDTIADTAQVVHIGILNRNMDAATNGVFLSGSPDGPAAVNVTEQDAEIRYMRTMPREGTRYVFNPQ